MLRYANLTESGLYTNPQNIRGTEKNSFKNGRLRKPDGYK